MAQIAQAAVADAKRAMYEEFQGDRGVLGNSPDLLEREFSRQDNLRKTHILEKPSLFRGADVGLRAGVELDRRQVEFKQPHILQDQCIRAGFVTGPGQLPCRFELLVFE